MALVFTREPACACRWESPCLMRLGLDHRCHLFSQTQRPHIGPNFLDVGKTLGFRAGFACIVPAQRVLPVGGPDGVLLFMIQNDFVDGCVFVFVSVHGCLFLQLSVFRL